ncbi:MAG: hypothetical protein PVI03_04185 [Candidatus Thorarchaeota archaeon]|jgi:hypothetical protein
MGINPITGKRYQLSKYARKKVAKYLPTSKPKKLPQSNRYCTACEKKRIFRLNPVIGHSRCTVCGGSFSKREDPNYPRKVWKLTKKAGVVEEKDILTPEQFAEKNVKWHKFVKIPVVVEAFMTRKVLYIKTLEGVMKANRGDWIIKGIAGEIYPCKHSIFEKTYQKVKTEGVKG